MAIFLNGNNDIRSIHYNGVDLTSVTFNDVIVWRKGSVLSNISNLAVHSVSYTSVILSYTLPKDATGVKIYCNTVSDVSSSNYIKVIDSLADTCEISSLSVNTTYYFAAYAYNSLTTSAPSNIVNAKTLSISTTAIQDWNPRLPHGAVIHGALPHQIQYRTLPHSAPGQKGIEGRPASLRFPL